MNGPYSWGFPASRCFVLCPECDEFITDCWCAEVRAHERDLMRDEADAWYAAEVERMRERAPA